MRHGIFQPVGDSVMPGGISRLLRTTPVLVDIARDVVELAPDAFFFNYSNPMTANVMAMSTMGRRDDVVGLCHGMHHVQHHLAAFIDKPFEETSTLYAGINHLTFIYDFRWNGHGRVAAGAREGRPRARRTGRSGRHRQHLRGQARRRGTTRSRGRSSVATARSPPPRTATSPSSSPSAGRSGKYFGKTLGVDAFSVPEILEWGENRYQSMVAAGRRHRAAGRVDLRPQSAASRSS